MPLLGLYLHIPFCESICNYCNFNRGLLDADLKRRYVRALEQEIRRAGDGAQVDTVYFGGGTPSLLEAHEVAGLLQACGDVFDLDQSVEVTLEVESRNRDDVALRSLVPRGRCQPTEFWRPIVLRCGTPAPGPPAWSAAGGACHP